MKHLALAVLVYAALVADATLSPSWSIGGAPPQLLWLVLLAALCVCGRRSGLLWSAAVGLAADTLGSGRMGVGPAVGVMLALVLGPVVARWRLPVLLLAPPLMFSASAAAAFALPVLQTLAERQLPELTAAGGQALGAAASTTVIGSTMLLAYRIVRRGWDDLSGGRAPLTNRWSMLSE